MFIPKTSKTQHGDSIHFSVGAIIRKNGKVLLVDRENAPFGNAGPAGHVEENENIEEALRHQVKEEAGLEVVSAQKIFEEEVRNNECKFGVSIHHWHVFECEVVGDVQLDVSESKSIGWYTPEEMRELDIEPIWREWFTKVKILRA
jgi:ADP-ribose pyrophosphatase YjhB (NUDIX family)